MTIVCAYFGPYDECPNCGGSLSGLLAGQPPRMDSFCSDDCAADDHDRRARLDADRAARTAARRAREDEFAREGDRLRQLGHTDTEIDVLLAHIPT